MIKHDRNTFTGEFSRIDNVGFYKNNQKYEVVLKNIRLAGDNSFFCKYARFGIGKGFKKLGKLLPGIKIRFNARITEYKPDRFSLSHPTKIELKNPASIKNLSVDYIPSEKKEIKIKKLGKRAKRDLLNKLIKEQKVDMKYNL